MRIKNKGQIANENYIINRINNFKTSQKRKMMLDGERYYLGDHDILNRIRTTIGRDGELEEIKNLPNNKIVDNQYKKMVDQKSNYLLGQPFSMQTENNDYLKKLENVFNKKFDRTMKNVCENSLNHGIAWLYIYYNDYGDISFKQFKAYEIIPEWEDDEHTELNYAIRVYNTTIYEGNDEKTVEKVEIYNDEGISYFELEGSKLNPCEPYHQNYFTSISANGVEQAYNWTKIPLIHFKYNSKEIPLIKMVKSLQDGLNIIESDFQNRMEEDTRNTILILENYQGEDLGNFRHNLALYGIVKVETVDNIKGDLRTLTVEVNAENYRTILELLKKAIIENAKGYDARDDRLNGNPNQMNIQSMYSDIDLDANGMETEFQASFEELLWFINAHLANTGQGDYETESVEFIFNRDMMISESEVIDNVVKSMGILSMETLLSNHTWVDSAKKEMDRKKAENTEATDNYMNAFNGIGGENTDEEE